MKFIFNRISVLALFVLFFSSCASMKGSSSADELYSARWNLVSLKSGAITPASADNIAHLIFYPGEEGRLAGSTGCNRLSGSFSSKGSGRLSFSPLVTTKMACPGQNTESGFLQALEGITRYTIISGRLNLYKGKELMATFEKGS